MMTRYMCTDGNADIEIFAETKRDAAQEYVDGGDWGDGSKTMWIDVYVQEIDEEGDEVGDRKCITITIEPTEPDCEDGETHDWRSPISVVGGIKENPGVYGHGGGVVMTEVCSHCGAYRETDTWAQRRDTGEQGLRSVAYRDADEDSLQWLESRKPKAETEAGVDVQE